MSPFEIGVAVYVLLGISLSLWGVATVKKRVGRFPNSPADIAQLKKGATSPWDPFSDEGVKKWRLIMFTMFGILMILLFTTG
jgi:hypothetical protein